MNENNKTYWKSFEELVKDPSYLKTLEYEFTEGTSEAGSEFHVNRRTFLKLLGASVALATTSCRRPVHKILPYVKQPENLTPGVAQYYASTFSLNNSSYGILVKTKEGRPIKIEGNPDHPLSEGSAGAFAQASVLELYDPNRKRNPTIDDKIVNWEEWDSATRTALKAAKNIRILTESTTSPTLRTTIEKFAAQLNAKWYEYEPISQETTRNAYRQAFGSPKIPKLHLDKAKVIVSLNHDFLGRYDSHELLKDWAKGRKIRSTKDTMNRLYVIESSFSLTGSNCDHRLSLKPSELLPFLLGLARILVIQYKLSQDEQVKSFLKMDPRWSLPSVKTGGGDDIRSEFLKALAEDLVKNKEQSILMVGQQESLELQTLGLFINHLLGTFSSNIIDKNVSLVTFDNGYQSIRPLLEEIKAKKVDCLITVGGNPLYTLPQLKDGFKNIPQTIRLSLYHDETAEMSKYTAPLSHFLEAWGDSYSQDGVVSLVQPTIQPLYKSRTAGEVFLTWLSKQLETDTTTLWLNEIKNHWKKYIYSRRNAFASFESFWEGALHDGVVLEKVPTARTFSFNLTALEKVKMDPRFRGDDKPSLELQVHPSYTLYDGRFSNSGWLQELPDPVTKVTWDNIASMSPKTALKYGLKEGDVIEVALNSSNVSLPVFLQAGLAQDLITTSIGYGRTAAGEIGNQVGSNVYTLGEKFQYENIQIKKLFKRHKLAVTQGHHNMEGRPIIREATLSEFKKNPEFVKEGNHHSLLSMYSAHEYKGHRWGMAIDLNTCVGCSGCVVACNAENNIPVVGKTQVVKGREMQWLRLDRYYEGSPENPRVLHQPMLCQHCENAPCEPVCPVAATTHSSEGLNEMTYNRCVGTRYCQNNCPYKVRRFNFLNYNVDIETPQELGKNPDVTVRMRGIMEKCTFCVQRINEEKTNGKLLGIERLPDGQVKTACQQACSTGSIVFGDLNDPNSQVSKLSKLSHGYHVLEELNTNSSITYLAKIRNPNPKLERA